MRYIFIPNLMVSGGELLVGIEIRHCFGVSDQGGIFTGKVAEILPGSLELSGEVLSKNHALLLRF